MRESFVRPKLIHHAYIWSSFSGSSAIRTGSNDKTARIGECAFEIAPDVPFMAAASVLGTSAFAGCPIAWIPIRSTLHQHVERILVAVEGAGKVVVNGVESPFRPGDVVFLRRGARHNFINTGTTPLKLFTTYSPPNHLPGRVHATKADAQADKVDEAFGANVQ